MSSAYASGCTEECEPAGVAAHTSGRVAIIGASELQDPLIRAAKARGLETHVFAWEAGDVGERTADVFHPISIVEKDAILDVCQELDVDGVCTIASDLANITVGYVAHALGLACNSPACVLASTDKHIMRQTFEAHGDPSPASIVVRPGEPLTESLEDFGYPLIVKPVDRSGSRGITKVDEPAGLAAALEVAFAAGFKDEALIEEFASGDEFSVEYISWQGRHTHLAITRKVTTGAPNFIERGHIEPAGLAEDVAERVRAVVEHALDSLGVTCGASHSEVKVDAQGRVRIIEIGSRMGGDCIGSDLVQLSTGIDFVGAVLDVALGHEPDLTVGEHHRCAAVKYVFGPEDVEVIDGIRREHPDWIVRESAMAPFDHAVTDSSSRFGFVVLAADTPLALADLGW